jgi:3-hydroxyacyl-[acyl-carrier-protein] dehydratase
MSLPADFSRALKNLPHGPEFRFIDCVTELEPGVRGSAEYKLRGDEPFLKGHFPGEPLMPGVLLIEAGAQLAGVVAQCDPNHRPLEGLKLTAVRGVKILGSASPSQTIQVEATIAGRMGNLVQSRIRALVEGKTVLEGEVTLSGNKL